MHPNSTNEISETKSMEEDTSIEAPNLKHIAIVTETYYPEINGVANTLQHWVQGMLSQNIKVTLIHPENEDSQELPHKSEQFHVFPVPGKPIPFYKSLRFGLPCKKRLVDFWSRTKPEVVYVATEGPLGLSALNAAKLLKIPVVSGLHTNFHHYMSHYKLSWLSPFVFKYLRYFHNRCDRTLVPTQIQQEELLSKGFERVHVLSRGVDTTKFSPVHRCDKLRASWGVSPSEKVLLYVGRIAAEKNIQLALETYHAIKVKHPETKFILVGNGPKFEEIAKQHPDIILAGVKRDSELARYYASGDLFLFPSKTDTFGNVVLEALSSGLPVISFDYAAGHFLMTDRVNGLLIPMNKDSLFISSSVSLFNTPNENWEEMSQQARNVATQYSWEAITDEFIHGLSTVVTKVCHYEEGKTTNLAV